MKKLKIVATKDKFVDLSVFEKMQLAMDPNTSGPDLLALSRDNNQWVSLAILRNPRRDGVVLLDLMASINDYVAFRAANVVIDLYTFGSLNVDDSRLCQAIQIISKYRQTTNLDTIQFLENLHSEREHNAWCYQKNESC